ncbi:MAG: MBOAT family O-acyltransferase [Oscillospiraceae bacterium]
MIFNSPTFLIFLAICAIVFYILPHKRQNLFLLLASYVCYMWAVPQYGVLVLGTTLLCFFCARRIDTAQNENTRKRRLAAGIIIPILILGAFKYFNFFMGGITWIFARFGVSYMAPEITWLLPVGISFYTFQLIGYCVDVYRGKLAHEKSFVDFALFISFFPQVLSGPIGRADELLPQYKKERSFCYGTVSEGIRRFLLGLFKKAVVADGFGLLVNSVYNNLREYSGVTLLAAALMYGVQIYFDFAGYSDMAIGAAKIFGITLRENFCAPYFASGIGEFWKRWHMSLTSWFRDYIYIPLGGNRRGFVRKLLNITIVFVASGLWHGASITFVVWGLVHAAARVSEELLSKISRSEAPKKKNPLLTAVKRIAVFVFASLAFVLFRADTLGDAIYVYSGILRGGDTAAQLARVWNTASPGITLGATYTFLFFAILTISTILVFAFDAMLARSISNGQAPIYNPLTCCKSTVTRWILYWYMGFASMLFYFICLTASRGAASFIYFGF